MGIILNMGFFKKYILFPLLLCLLHYNGFGQQQPMDSLYFVKLHVVIDETSQPACDAEILFEGSEGSFVTTFTDSAGYCTISNLSGENTYSFTIFQGSCFSERHKIRQHDSCSMNTEIEIRLVPMVIDFIHFPVFQFRHGSAKIKADSAFYESMEYMNFMMGANPNFVLQISGYTEPGEKSSLEKKRALKIHHYLINAGVDNERMIVNTQPAHHAVLRYNYDGCHPSLGLLFITKEFLSIRSKADQQRIRQECRQVRFEIISTDYNPKKTNNE